MLCQLPLVAALAAKGANAKLHTKLAEPNLSQTHGPGPKIVSQANWPSRGVCANKKHKLMKC